jgi:prepilin-type N-terminal cleavage/methylation domain-containing protein
MSQRGYSLVEVLAALLILTLIILTSLAVFVERDKRLRQASEYVLAYQALANEAEYQRRIPYGNLQPSVAFASTTEYDILAGLGPHATQITVKQTQPGVKNVTMTIYWRGTERSAQLELVRVDTGGTNLW